MLRIAAAAGGVPVSVARFDSTQWSLVLRAREDTPDARTALDRLCRAYRPPVVAYIRNRGYAADATEDLAQTFFTQFIEDAYHETADPARGRFRAFLLIALKRFLINADAEAHTLKRGGAISLRRLDDSQLNADQIALNGDGPEQAFDRSWAMTVLDKAMRKLRAEAEQAGKSVLFEQLAEFLTERPDEADYARASATLKLRRNTLAVAVHRLRHRLRELVRAELSQTTAAREDLEAELRELRSTLAGVMT
jgi:RNA polymerase sigma-70 factor (ECF subfamily)